jgi:hypothetical protein
LRVSVHTPVEVRKMSKRAEFKIFMLNLVRLSVNALQISNEKLFNPFIELDNYANPGAILAILCFSGLGS